MNATKVIVIGGFGVNQRPLADLIEPLTDYSFIDVNAFPAPFTLETLAQQISAQLAKQSDPYYLIAYSCGGLLALKLAKLMPQQIKTLILINATPELKTDQYSDLIVDSKNMETSIKNVFAGGDIVGGEGTVIEAMGMAKKAALAIMDKA